MPADSTPASASTGQTDANANPPAADTGGGEKTKDKAGEAAPPASILGAQKEEKKEGQPADDKGKPGQSANAGELEIKLPEKLPEGVTVNEAALSWFKGVAKEIGLNSENASKFAAKYLERAAEEAKGHEDAWRKQGNDWHEQLKADKAFGGENFKKNVDAAQKAVKWAFGEEAGAMMAELSARGLDNFPFFVRLAAKFGGALAEDDSAGGARGGAAPTDEQTKLKTRYPSMFNADGSPKR